VNVRSAERILDGEKAWPNHNPEPICGPSTRERKQQSEEEKERGTPISGLSLGIEAGIRVNSTTREEGGFLFISYL